MCMFVRGSSAVCLRNKDEDEGGVLTVSVKLHDERLSVRCIDDSDMTFLSSSVRANATTASCDAQVSIRKSVPRFM